MTSERRQTIEAIFLEATELPDEERAAFLNARCGNDTALREEVEKLIAHYLEAEGRLMDEPAFKLTEEIESPLANPIRVGRYRVERPIGEGGMGVVYEAKQEDPHRTVAVKVIQPGLASRSTLSRFRHEAELLARLQHPGIAHIYEAGVASVAFDDGTTAKRPFFAMEYIRGKTLTDHARHKNLGTRERMKLMARICDAVQHAHQKGVIHRDLKPQNILVDEEGQPKILDFGVARTINADMETLTLRTDLGQLVGTLAYMSPEQVQGDSALLDTRSDVYALGVILFELLSGRLPLATRTCTVPEATRIIQEQDPVRLSKINPAFRGDLETIVQKALEKTKERRYSSAAVLAMDIRRYLNDEPIIARPQTRIYQIRKFAKRHKGLVAGLFLAFAALVIGLTVAVHQAVLAQAETERTRKALDEAEAVTVFLTEMLASADPYQLKRDILVSEALAIAARDLDKKWRDRPLIEARIRQAIGRTYYTLGSLEEAERHLTRAHALQRELLGEEDDSTRDSLQMLGMVYLEQGRYQEAEPIYDEVLESRRRRFGNDHAKTLNAVANYGNLLWDQGRYDEAEPYHMEALAGFQRTLGPDHLETLQAQDDMGALLLQQGRLDEAEACMRACMPKLKQHLGEDHPHFLTTLTNMGAVLRNLGRFDEAHPYFLQALEGQKKVLGKDHPHTFSAMNNLGAILNSLQRNEEAEALYREAVEGCRSVLGAGHTLTLSSLTNLGHLLLEKGDLAAAERAFEESLENSKHGEGEEHPSRLNIYNGMGLLRRLQGRLAESQDYFSLVLEGSRSQLGEDHPWTLATCDNLGILLIEQDKVEEAVPYFRQASDGFLQMLGSEHSKTQNSLTHLCRALDRLNRSPEAEPYRKHLISHSNQPQEK